MIEGELHVLCGLPGLGKSTYAEKMRETGMPDALLIASDDVRWSFGPEYKPGAERFVWQVIEGFVKGRLSHNGSVIVDSTALTRRKRTEMLGWAFPTASRTVLHYLRGGPDLSAKRSAKHIKRADIDRLWSSFEEPEMEEGWSQIIVVDAANR